MAKTGNGNELEFRPDVEKMTDEALEKAAANPLYAMGGRLDAMAELTRRSRLWLKDLEGRLAETDKRLDGVEERLAQNDKLLKELEERQGAQGRALTTLQRRGRPCA